MLPSPFQRVEKIPAIKIGQIREMGRRLQTQESEIQLPRKGSSHRRLVPKFEYERAFVFSCLWAKAKIGK